ncbi:GNAT family N-acetyltransferase [Halorubellus sp. PRR65]|uniref:GNAT family N-acetyltransferase n=1 Tax=Halorubellus sp. PRR65 TaxID=3098148 RepID=UPI002B261A4B|nr:GNAT family N-acetyltransferase [Halorubellus sp. PRR65]
MASNACGAWWHGDCEGTDACPPRCPRFRDRDDGRPYLVRPAADATDDSMDDVVAMYRDYPAEHRSMGVPPVHDARIREWLDRLADRGRNVVATLDGDVVGHAAYAPLHADVPEMLVYVDPDHHGRGLGTELTKHVLAYAASDGCDGVALDVARDNPTAIGVYESLGFEPTDETPMEVEMAVDTDHPVVLHVRRPPADRDLHEPN